MEKSQIRKNSIHNSKLKNYSHILGNDQQNDEDFLKYEQNHLKQKEIDYNLINNRVPLEYQLSRLHFLVYLLSLSFKSFSKTLMKEDIDIENYKLIHLPTFLGIFIPFTFLIVFLYPTLIYKIQFKKFYFVLQIPFFALIVLRIIALSCKIELQNQNYSVQVIVVILISTENFISYYVEIILPFIYLERLAQQNNLIKVGKMLVLYVGLFCSEIIISLYQISFSNLLRNKVYINSCIFVFGFVSLVLAYKLKPFYYQDLIKLNFVQSIKNQFINLTKSKSYLHLNIQFLSLQLINCLNTNLLDMNNKMLFEENNNQILQFETLYNISKMVTFFLLSNLFIDKVKRLDLAVQSSILISIIINIGHSRMNLINNEDFQRILTILTGFAIALLQVQVITVYVKRSNGNIELIHFSVWLFYIFTAIQEASQINLNYFRFYNYALFTIQFVIMIIVIWQKNYFEIIQDPEFIQNCIDQSLENFALTKEQFNIRYTFVEKIRDGASGSVFKYYDNYFKKNYAVKIIITNKVKTFENQKQELEKLEYLQGIPNIINIHKFVLCQEDMHTFQIFLVMDQAEGTLMDQIEQRMKTTQYFANEEIINMIKTLVTAFAKIKLHAGLQHRDIKPQNILYMKNQWYISDFGTSKYDKSTKILFRNNGNVNQSNIGHNQIGNQDITITGTPKYMDPQLLIFYKNSIQNVKNKNKNQSNIINDDEFDYFKSDVFSLGLTILQACILQDISKLNQSQSLIKQKIEKLIEIQIYEPIVVEIIKKMLEWNQQIRPHFEEINLILNQFQNNEE